MTCFDVTLTGVSMQLLRKNQCKILQVGQIADYFCSGYHDLKKCDLPYKSKSRSFRKRVVDSIMKYRNRFEFGHPFLRLRIDTIHEEASTISFKGNLVGYNLDLYPSEILNRAFVETPLLCFPDSSMF